MKHPARGFFATALLATLLLTALAAAETGPTRPEYVAQLETICKPGSEATQRAVDGVKADVRAERLTIAATKFAKAAKIFGGTVKAITPVPRPPADTAKLKTWFGYLARQEAYLKKIAADLRAGQTIASQGDTARFVHNGNLSNRTVLAFGFHYCSFELTRFG
jgi:hypothetical protein